MPRKWQPLQPPSLSQAYVQLWDVHVQIDLCSHLWRLEALLRASAAAWQCQVGMEHENTLRTEARSDSFSQSAGDIHLSTWQDFPSGITNHSDCAWRFYGSKIGEGGGEGRRREWEIRSQATEIRMFSTESGCAVFLLMSYGNPASLACQPGQTCSNW